MLAIEMIIVVGKIMIAAVYVLLQTSVNSSEQYKKVAQCIMQRLISLLYKMEKYR